MKPLPEEGHPTLLLALTGSLSDAAELAPSHRLKKRGSSLSKSLNMEKEQ